MRMGLRTLLSQNGLTVVGEAADGNTAANEALRLNPDLVVMEENLPIRSGVDTSARIIKCQPKTRVILLATTSMATGLLRALKYGASGFVARGQARNQEIITAIQAIERGEMYLSPGLASKHEGPLALRTLSTDPLENLTERQREVLQLIAEGQTTKNCALILKLSDKTVEYHRAKLMAALRIWDIPGLVRFAVRTGLVTEEQ